MATTTTTTTASPNTAIAIATTTTTVAIACVLAVADDRAVGASVVVAPQQPSTCNDVIGVAAGIRNSINST